MHFDVVILGWGKAGKSLAADLGAQGRRVALIERSSSMYGGTCINVGCVPTKDLTKWVVPLISGHQLPTAPGGNTHRIIQR